MASNGIRLYRDDRDVTPATRAAAIDELVRAVATEGKRIPAARIRAIAAEYEQASARLYLRAMAALEVAATACEVALGGQRWCDRPGTAERDGHRVCRKHERAGSVRWEA
jgi:hypothetical protein